MRFMRTLLISTILMLSLATPAETVTAANTHSRQTASVCQNPQRDRHKKHKRHKRKRHYIITADKVYYDRQAVSGASASSFKEMKDGYAADDFTVYYEGKKIIFDLIAPQWDYKLNDSSHNIESIQDCLARAKKFLDKIKKEYPNKNILIVSHGSFIKTLHFNLVGYDENTDFLSFNPKNTTLYEYDYE